jgi:hypothetical protein
MSMSMGLRLRQGFSRNASGKGTKDKGKDNTEIALDAHGPDFEKVLLPEVHGDIGLSWCKSSVAW